MFKKKKNVSSFNETDSVRRLVYDFLLRLTKVDFESYRTVDYTLYHKLEESEMIPRLDEHLQNLLSGNVDSGNADMLDEVVVSTIREAIPELYRQRHEHRDLLERYIVRRTADKEDILSIRKGRQEELDVMQKDYEKICEEYEKWEVI